MSIKLFIGDCREILQTLPDQSIHCIVTSPPYFGLRDYGVAGQIGLESTPDAYVAELVAVFREVRRVLRADGTCWLNLGDSYNNIRSQMGPRQAVYGREKLNGKPDVKSRTRGWPGLKEKDLIGIPWMVAFALRADGWWLRSDIIWHKPNPMPESVRDRPTKSHEYLFLLTKSERYYYDSNAIAEKSEMKPQRRLTPQARRQNGHAVDGWKKPRILRDELATDGDGTRNARSVWTIATQPYAGAHFATFPSALAERCIKAGCPPGGTVLDPFTGAGTTLLSANRLSCDAIGIELNPIFAALAENRLPKPLPEEQILALLHDYVKTLA